MMTIRMSEGLYKQVQTEAMCESVKRNEPVSMNRFCIEVFRRVVEERRLARGARLGKDV